MSVVEDSASTLFAQQSGECRPPARLLSTLDVLLSVLVVTPLVVGCWRGTWQLLDFYGRFFPPWESCVVGTLIHVVVSSAQEGFHGLVAQQRRTRASHLLAFLFTKAYTGLLNVVTNLHWRGIWMLLDHYLRITRLEGGTYSVERGGAALALFAASLALMGGMRCLRNMNSPPFEICLDSGDDMFLFPNMFKVKASEAAALYALDVLFSVVVVVNLGIVAWRGLWLLADLCLFATDASQSAWASLVLGYALVAVVFLLQACMKRACDALSGLPRLLLADAYMLLAIAGAVNVWRGIWNLLDIHFLPGSGPLGLWICHGAALALLMALGCSNSLLVRGVCLDCEEPDGSCVVFPCRYLRAVFLREQRLYSGNPQQPEAPSIDRQPASKKTCASSSHYG